MKKIWSPNSPEGSSSALDVKDGGNGLCIKSVPWIPEVLQQHSLPGTGSPIILGQHPQHCGSENQQSKEVQQYSVYSAPVSPPSQPQDVPPPLLDFHSEQLMTEIQNMTFDMKENGLVLSSQLFPDSGQESESSTETRLTTTTANHTLQPSQQQFSRQAPHTSFASSQPLAKSSVDTQQSLLSLPISLPSHPTLLQPKLERSDSICSDYAPTMKEEFLSYTESLAGLDDYDNDTSSVTPPSSQSSPHIFSPSQTASMLNSPDKNTGIFFNKSFETKQQNKSAQNEAFDSLFSSSPTQTSSSISFCTSNKFTTSQNESPKPYTALSHKTCESPKSFKVGPSNGDSPSSRTQSTESQHNILSPQETPVTLLTSPKSRNRRNSSFDETKPHVCPQCGARFTTKSNLGQHAKIHLAVKPFICEICSHGFTRAAHYESHVAKHKGLKTHRCDQCGESFARLDNLLRHSARHKHGKIFDCSVCGKGFHRKDKLLEHEKVHSESTFPCLKCSKTFHTNDALKHHQPLHEDASKTQCKVCLKFILLKSLSKHMSAFHKESLNNPNENNNNINNNTKSKSRSRSNNNSNSEKMHGCQYCKKSFVSPAKLRLHTAKYHAEERLNEPPLQINESEMNSIGISAFNLTETSNISNNSDNKLRFFEDRPRYPSPASDGLPSQQVPEMELSYINSSPEDISDFGSGKEMGGVGGNSYSIPTIHIPEFESLQSKMADNSEISTEAIQALFFN